MDLALYWLTLAKGKGNKIDDRRTRNNQLARFARDSAGFRIGSPLSWETPQSQKNQDDFEKVTL